MSMNADEGSEDIFKHVIVDKNLINDSSPSIDLFNLDYFRERIALLKVSRILMLKFPHYPFYFFDCRNPFQNHFSFMP